MAEIIKKNALGGGDKEEEPIIVAQRFLNIFHQLHVFDEERRDVYNKMLMELPEQVKTAFRQLPGGSVLLEYIDELEGINTEQVGVDTDINLSQNSFANNNAAPSAQNVTYSGIPFDSSEFAKVLANTLAQSNAQIVRELQKNVQLLSSKAPATSQQSPVTLTTDESFTQAIAEALGKAISSSEQKRQEDTKIIANSFLELQENLAKMIEQNAQLKVVADGKISKDGVSALNFKNIINDLVNSQTKFLKETSQSQKEELASIVSSAIKESIKLSTQSVADTFRQMYNEPSPITYASPEQKKQNLSEIEDIIKAQGREFSSIIAGALRESQKNSTQSIIKTIEGLKPSSIEIKGQKTDDILKEQMKLFREITREQNKEFSSLIASALKEGQKQSAAIIGELVKNLQNQNSVTNDVLSYSPTTFYPRPEKAVVTEVVEKDEPKQEPTASKKKKKKKKNANNIVENNVTENIVSTPEIYTLPLKKDTPANNKINFPIIDDDKPKSVAEEWGFGSDDNIDNAINDKLFTDTSEDQTLRDNVTDEEEFVDFDDNNASNFESDTTADNVPEAQFSDNQSPVDMNDEQIDGEEGKDWEWAYEEVDDNWEDGEEGKDWEWGYEEIEEPAQEIEEPVKEIEEPIQEIEESAQKVEELSQNIEEPVEEPAQEFSNDIVENSQIIIPDEFKLLLTGFEADNFEDPYCENVDDIY